MSDIKDKEEIIDDSTLDNGVDLKNKKRPHIKKEDRKKLKARKKKAIKIKKQRAKKSFLGFSGRVSIILFFIALIFITILYLFIYLNYRLDFLRNEKNKMSEILLSWERLINATNRLLIIEGKQEKNEAIINWQLLYKEFELVILDFFDEGGKKEEENLEGLEKIKKNIDLFLDSTINLILNFISPQRQILVNQFNSNLSANKTRWGLVKTQLNEIEDSLKLEKIEEFVERDDTSFLVEYGQRISQRNIDKEFSETIENITEFYSISQLFVTSLDNSINLLYSDINMKSRFINFLMIVMANIISIIAILFIIIFFFYLRGTVIKPLTWLIRETERIGQGDLTGKIKVRRTDEIGTLTTAFNTTVTDLKTLVQQINIAIIVITKTLSTLFKSSTDVKESANAQATTIENTRENFEKLDSMIKTITEETTKAYSYTGEALNKTELGLKSIEDLEKEMNKIETSSEEITDIIGLINYIAEQTSLLSINASIEAARAGEYGKGFNVVANEIKQLADRSTQSANRIYELITYNSKIIQEGVNLSRNTANLLSEIAGSTRFSANIVRTINEESQNIHRNSNEILGVINYIAEVAQVNLIEIENVTNATMDLGDQSVNLQKFIGQFDARSQDIKGNQKHIEDILRNKLEIAEDIIKTLGESFLPTGNKIEVKTPANKRYIAEELQIGDSIVTYNNDFADSISKKTNTSVSFFQKIGRDFVRVSTTVQNYDTTRALGTVIKRDSDIYNTVINKEIFYGRIFIVNRWYISVYDPIIDGTGNIVGCMNLAIAEEMEVISEISKETLQEDVIEKKKVLTA